MELCPFQNHFGTAANDYKDSGLWFKIGMKDETVENVKQRHFLEDYLHPTLTEMAISSEHSILRLQCASEILLNRYAGSVYERQIEIENLAKMAMQNFAMFASLGRASRSYCIGLRYSVYETVAAGCLVQSAERDVLKMALDIKHNRSEYHDLHRTITENSLEKYRNQSIPIPSVIHSRVIQKVVK